MSAPSTAPVRGSCLCGNIAFEVSGGLNDNNMCWCNSCRKTTGSVAMANTWCKKECLKFLRGDESTMKTFMDRTCDSGGCIERSFCGDCGSTLLSENKGLFPGCWIVPFGSLDLDPTSEAYAPKAEYFVKRKVPWVKTPEQTVKYPELF